MSLFCYHFAFSLLYYTPTNNNKASVDAVSVSYDYAEARVCFEHSVILFYGTVKRCFMNDQQART